MTTTEVAPHSFTGPDEKCELCGMGPAHPYHDQADEPGPREAAPQREAAPTLEDGLVDELAPAPVAQYEDGTAEETLAGLDIHDLDWATWAARKRHRITQRITQHSRVAADQHARINAWLEREAASLQRDLTFFDGLLRGFHERALAADPKNAKTVRLPDGTELASQAGKLAVTITDVKALEAWAEANEVAEELLRFPDPEPKKTEIAKRFKSKAEGETEPGDYPAVDEQTGEVVPGVSITRKPRSFTVNGPADEDPA